MSSNKYQCGKIYKIVDNSYTLCYYGSTTQSLSRRMTTHRSIYTLFKDGKINRKPSACEIFDTYGLENCKIELVELFPCGSKEELRKKEGEYIKNNDCINKKIAGRTQPEYVDDNRDRINERRREWANTNKDRINEVRRQRDKEFRQNNPDLVKERHHTDYVNRKEYLNAKNKEWKASHQAEIKAQRDKYYEENKERINQKHICPVCNGSYSQRHKTAHEKTTKHQDALKANEIQGNVNLSLNLE